MKSFSDYLQESKSKAAILVWGRMNPPTIGHEKLLNKASSEAGDLFIYLSQTTDKKKNPLDYQSKIKYARKMFPKYARNIHLDKNVKTIFDLLVKIYDSGYQDVKLVAGSDRIDEYETLLAKYNGVDGRHGYYNFKTITIISAGHRDPDSDGATGMSASKLRAAAESNDFPLFQKGLPTAFKEAQELFNEIRKGLGLKESTHFRHHIQLKSISENREEYVKGKLFSIGDEVVINESQEIGVIELMGSNYIIIKTCDNKKYRKWIDDVSLLKGLE